MDIDLTTRREAHRQLASALAEERRGDRRLSLPTTAIISWHHNLSVAARYEATDVSEGGFRINSKTVLPEGLTGRAYCSGDGCRSPLRPAMVAWCRAVRDLSGKLLHYEAGIRLFCSRGPTIDN